MHLDTHSRKKLRFFLYFEKLERTLPEKNLFFQKSQILNVSRIFQVKTPLEKDSEANLPKEVDLTKIKLFSERNLSVFAEKDPKFQNFEISSGM